MSGQPRPGPRFVPGAFNRLSLQDSSQMKLVQVEAESCGRSHHALREATKARILTQSMNMNLLRAHIPLHTLTMHFMLKTSTND